MRRALLLTLALSLLPQAQAQVAASPQSTSPVSQGTSPAFPCTLGALPAPQSRAVFVLDTSGSMRGIGDGRANIFAGVKRSIADYVAKAAPGRVELLTFDSGLKTRHGYDLPAQAQQFQADLDALKADGNNTYLYRSLTDALTPLTGKDQFVTNVFVLTDGIDNERNRRATAASALASFRERGPLDTLTYIALGTDIPSRARAALEASDYASGLTLPVGELPQLANGLGTATLRVTDPAHIAVPYPDGTPVTLGNVGEASAATLLRPTVQGGEVALNVTRNFADTEVLLCAAPSNSAREVAARTRKVLLRFNSGRTAPAIEPPMPLAAPDPSGLVWLNPGANLNLRPGQDTTLRYRLPASLGPDDSAAVTLPPENTGLEATLERLPGASEFAVHLKNVGAISGQTLAPTLQWAGQNYVLPSVTLQAGEAPAGTRPPTTPLPESKARAWWLLPLLALLLLALALLILWLLARRKAAKGGGANKGGVPRGAKLSDLIFPQAKGLAGSGDASGSGSGGRSVTTTHTVAAAPSHPITVGAAGTPSITGLEYREDRTLALLTDRGESRAIATPRGGPFDLGLVAKVPLLSGLRAQQDREGLRLLNIPADLEVTVHGQPVMAGMVVPPQTTLGVGVAKPARAPHPPLGSLVGLGVPLSLRPEGTTLHVLGPYGTHSLALEAGITDLGEAFGAAALAGLKLSPSGGHLLLVDLPDDLALYRPGDLTPLAAGTYLPSEVNVTLPNNG